MNRDDDVKSLGLRGKSQTGGLGFRKGIMGC